MAIVRAPLKTDAAGKCSRWRVILYNPTTHKQEWHTVNGTRRDAQAFERDQKTRLAKGVYIAKSTRKTFAEVAALYLQECRVRNRRTSTLLDYESVLRCHLMPKDEAGNLLELGPREVGSLRKSDFTDLFTRLRLREEDPITVNTVNKALTVAKTILNFAVDRELTERNVLTRFKPYERDPNANEPEAHRGAFSEPEVRQLLAAATPFERALIGVLCFGGLRPGEVYALDWSCVDLEGGSLQVERSWDHLGRKFVQPKTKAGQRTVGLSTWLVAELKAHRERTSGAGLVFPNRVGKPLHPSNVATRLWQPLRKRAGVSTLDMYSLRHTFASLGRTSGESAFNVSRAMGHSRSTLVDQVYAHGMTSGLASVAENVTARVMGKPQLRVIEGGQRDIRQPLDETGTEEAEKTASA